MANLILNREDRMRTWALILVGLILFAGGPMLVTSGSLVATDSQLFDAGKVTVDFPGGTGGALGPNFSPLINVNFHKTFPSPPNVTLTVLSDNGSGINGFLATSAHEIVAPGAPATWAAMPSATTELFGAARNRVVIGQENTALAFAFSVNVVTPGTASAFLKFQVSQDQITWTDITQNGCPYPISISSACTIGDFNCFLASNILIDQWLRVVGFGGNGVVSPAFGNIEMVLEQPAVFSAIETPFCIINSIFNQCQLPTTTGFGFTVILTENAQIGGDTRVIVAWQATGCASGLKSC